MARDTRRSCLRERPQDEYRFLAERRRFEWLGPFPRNTKASTVWRCVNGHAFHACYNNVDQEMNCTFSRENRVREHRHTQAAYHALAERRGIFWLGPPVTSALAPTVWECASGPSLARAVQLNTTRSGLREVRP